MATNKILGGIVSLSAAVKLGAVTTKMMKKADNAEEHSTIIVTSSSSMTIMPLRISVPMAHQPSLENGRPSHGLLWCPLRGYQELPS